MPGCAAFNCTNRQFKGCERTFHRFPFGRPDLLNVWIDNVRRDKWAPSRTSLLCSDHFTKESFGTRGKTTRLKRDAVPTIFSFPAHLQKDERPMRNPPKARHLPAEPTTLVEPTGSIPEDASQSSKNFPTQGDHAYCIRESPWSVKRKLDTALDKVADLQKKLKKSQQQSRRLKKKVSSLQEVVYALQKKQLISSGGAEMLEKTIHNIYITS